MPSPTPSPERPTLRDIARSIGLSHTTVSLCLRNDPSIPASTRERVRAAADRLGYRTNVLVSTLMTQVRLKHQKSSPEVVAFLTGGASAREWENHSACVGVFAGAREQAPKLGMRVEPFWLGPGGASSAATCRVLAARAIRGVLIAPFPVPVYSHELDWPRLICVGLGYVFKDHPLHRATHNHFHGVFTAYENLFRLGYRRIGLALENTQNSRVGFNWLGGFLAARSMLGGAALEPWLAAEPGDVAAFKAWRKRQRPDAVLGFGPQQYLTIVRSGCRVPEDLAFAALDIGQMHLADVSEPAGIDQNLPRIGSTAIDLLATQLYHNEQGLPSHPVLSMIEGSWVAGRTAPPL
ncbi:MAG: LacI family DNA-binding transcriptional regulator [Opitutaceae bacterium]